MLEYFINVQFSFLLLWMKSRSHLKGLSRMLPIYLLKLFSESFKIQIRAFFWDEIRPLVIMGFIQCFFPVSHKQSDLPWRIANADFTLPLHHRRNCKIYARVRWLKFVHLLFFKIYRPLVDLNFTDILKCYASLTDNTNIYIYHILYIFNVGQRFKWDMM